MTDVCESARYVGYAEVRHYVSLNRESRCNGVATRIYNNEYSVAVFYDLRTLRMTLVQLHWMPYNLHAVLYHHHNMMVIEHRMQF